MEKFQGWNNKQSLKHIHKNIFINLFVIKWWTNITFRNASPKDLKEETTRFETWNQAYVLLMLCWGKLYICSTEFKHAFEK